MAVLRLFAAARTAAGTTVDSVDGRTVGDVISSATMRYGDEFASVLPTCAIWLNGKQATADEAVGENDEVAILPPVSGGAR